MGKRTARIPAIVACALLVCACRADFLSGSDDDKVIAATGFAAAPRYIQYRTQGGRTSENNVVPVLRLLPRILADDDLGEFYAAVILERGQPLNPEFCKALIGINITDPEIGYDIGADPTVQLYHIVWPDRRSATELQAYLGGREISKKDCFDLLETFDYEGSRAYSMNFDLPGQGPWLVVIDRRNKRAVYLDFGGYEELELGEAVAKWRRKVLGNQKLRTNKYFGMVNLFFGGYSNEIFKGRIHIHKLQ
jgi:hypothetical protein